MLKDNMAMVSARVDTELQKEAKKKLVDDDKSFADLVRSALKQYVNGEFVIKD